MCRDIKTPFNYQPPATVTEIRAPALQFVRKVSGSAQSSETNEAAFAQTVDDIESALRRFLDALVSASPPKDREV